MKESTAANDLLYPDVLRIRFVDGNMAWDFADGRSCSVPLAWYPTLMLASPTERADYHITHYAAHWPHLDYDLGANAIICGHKESAFFSQQAWKKYNAKVSSGESLAA